MSLAQKLKKEIIEILIITGYFLFCFSVLILIKTLTLAQVNIKFYGYSAALVGALIMSKIVIILDKTRLGKVYIRQALYKNVLIKSVVYTLVLTFVLFIENLIHELLNGHHFIEALKSIHEHRDPMQFRLILIASFFSLGSYNIIIGIRDSMEKGALINLFFKPKENQ
jgi:hypothetical protein